MVVDMLSGDCREPDLCKKLFCRVAGNAPNEKMLISTNLNLHWTLQCTCSSQAAVCVQTVFGVYLCQRNLHGSVTRNYSVWRGLVGRVFPVCVGRVLSLCTPEHSCGHQNTSVGSSVNVDRPTSAESALTDVKCFDGHFLFFLFVSIQWISHCMVAGVITGAQQTTAAGSLRGNPDLSSFCFPRKSVSLLLSSYFSSLMMHDYKEWGRVWSVNRHAP